MGEISGTPASTGTGPGRVAADYALDYQTDPFSSVVVDRLINGGTVVTWGVERAFGGTTPWTFILQFGRAGTENWTTVATVTDTFQVVDSTRRRYSTLSDGYYRIRLIDGAGNVYISTPSSFPENWTENDLRIVDEIRRKEHFLYKKRSGIKCWVLYRKRFGEICGSCTDSVTQEVTDPQCTACYGTGYTGGYWAPVPTYCIVSKTGEDVIEDFGTVITRQMGVRITPIPVVREYDLLILEGSDLRMVVRKPENVAEYKGHVIVQNLALEVLDPDDVVYEMTWGGSKDPADGQSEIWGVTNLPS